MEQQREGKVTKRRALKGHGKEKPSTEKYNKNIKKGEQT